jgi:hypothetical protein
MLCVRERVCVFKPACTSAWVGLSNVMDATVVKGIGDGVPPVVPGLVRHGIRAA